MYELTDGSPELFIQDNGVRREFCGNCGSFIVEYGEANVDKFRYAYLNNPRLKMQHGNVNAERQTGM